MSDNIHLSSYAQLKKLRTALAIGQGMKLLATLQHEAEDTVSHDQAKRVTYLTELFSRIHREIFSDWRVQATVHHRPGTMSDADKRREFRQTIERLVLDGDNQNQDSAIFDNNGFVIHTDNIAERLGRFYFTMKRVRPFAYGNRLTLDFFMTALGNLPAFKSVYEQGIDFRRLAIGDSQVLHDTASSCAAITSALQNALDASRTKNLNNHANGYGRWPENKKFMSGIPFLSHKTPNGVDCLVLVNGGLVPLQGIRRDLFTEGKHFADYPLPSKDDIIGYLPNTESLRADGKRDIDGIALHEDGSAPLFCLDVNLLTGLRAPAHTELMDLLKQCAGDKVLVFELANNPLLKDKLLLAANGDYRLHRAVEIAYARLANITAKLDRAKREIFDGKTPVSHPTLFMCMGGAGSGKTAVDELATAQCGGNFVTASLDEFRKLSDLYQVLTAASHHSDDYVYVEPFANRLRSMVAEHALQARINILYDGTGIPYKPRYSGIIEKFKEAGFHTQITAVDAFLVKPEGREDELPRSAVVTSVKNRFQDSGRALPWVVTVDKHIRAPDSFLKALQHSALDKISLFANDGLRDKHYLVAESFLCNDDDIRALHRHQWAGSLTRYFKAQLKQRSDSVLLNLARGNNELLEALLNRNPCFDENNVAYQVYYGQSCYRVLHIYNTRRMVDFIEKRQLNPNAAGEEGLLHKPQSLSFHVDPLLQKPWLTRLQDAVSRQ